MGRVEGTNNEDLALDLAESEDYFVVDTQTNDWLNPGRERNEIIEAGL